MFREPKAVDEATQQSYSDEAGGRFQSERAVELARRENRSRSARLHTAQQDALRLGVDGRHELARDRSADRLAESHGLQPPYPVSATRARSAKTSSE